MKTMRMRCVRHSEYMKKLINIHKILVGQSKKRGHLVDLSIEGRIILN